MSRQGACQPTPKRLIAPKAREAFARAHSAAPRLITGLLSLCALMTVSTAAYAGRTESRLWLGAGANSAQPGTDQHQLGPGAQLGFSLSLSDFWSLQLGVDGAYHLADAREEEDAADDLPDLYVADAFVGVQYNLDVIQYIPYVSAGVVGYLQAPPYGGQAPGPDLGARLSLGMYWRASRDWSLGGAIDLHSSLTNFSQFNLYTLINLNVGYHWGW